MIFVDNLYKYCNEYVENNYCTFLLEDIINTKIFFSKKYDKK